MATPNQIQGGRWDDYLRSKYSLKGGPVSPEIASEIVPVTSIPFELEDFFLLGDKLVIGRASQAAVTAEFSQVSLNNSPGSGHLLIVDGFWARTVQDRSTVSFLQGVVLSGVNTFQRVMDGRWDELQPTSGVAFVRRGSNPTLQGGAQILLHTNIFGFYEVPSVLAPGDTMLLESNTINQSVDATFRWRETILEASASG